MDENKQGTGKPTIDKEYLKKLAEKIKAEKAKKESMNRPADSGMTPPPPPIASITPKLLDDDDEEEDMAAEKTAIIDLAALSGHSADARLTILDGKDEGKSIDITREEVIAGRSLDNDFVISDISVSRKHFKVVRDGDHYAVSDMGSGNGIKVNGSKTPNAVLYHNDVIIAGARQIRFEILNEEMKEKFSRKVEKIDVAADVPVKSKSSALAWVAILVVLSGVAAGVYLFKKQSEQIAIVQQEQAFKLGIEDIDKIDELIEKKELKDAEKNVQFFLEKAPGNKQLIERQTLINKEKEIQVKFEQAKVMFAQNKEEAEKTLKLIPEDSMFYDDMKAFVGPEIISRWLVSEIKGLLESKKEDEALKKIYAALIENPDNEEIKKLQSELALKVGAEKAKDIQAKATEEKKAVAAKKEAEKEKRLERKKIANANKPAPKPKPAQVDNVVSDSGQASLDRAVELYLSKDFDSASNKLDDASQSSDKDVSKKASLMKLELAKFKRQWTKSQKEKGAELRAGIEKLLKYDEKISGGQMSSDIQALNSASSSESKSSKSGSKMGDEKAKELYMQARSLRNENQDKARELLNQIIDGTDSSSDYNAKAKKLLKTM
ncbi:MAG TPA: FHA domain-containing protein [bacterium]|nr:FHA domain-containing protein [bacterium]